MSLTPTSNGSHTGNSSVSTGCRLWASSRKKCVSETMKKKSFPSTPRLQRISNFYSPLAGVSCGASLTVPITTFPAMQRFPVRICLTLTIPRMKNISLMLLSRLWVQTVSFWHFYALLMTRKSWRAEMSVLSFISIRLWHRLKSASCRCPRSSTRVQRRSIPSCARSTTANLTTEAISVRDIAVRMKSVRRSALPTISNPRQTAA